MTAHTDLVQTSPTSLTPSVGTAADPAVTALLRELDLTDSHSVMFFGAKAQEQLTQISDRMLEGVRAKDIGPAGAALSEMVTTLKGFDVAALDPNRKPGFFARIMGQGRPIARFLEEYEAVRDQIEAIGRTLERHKTQLLTDVTSLDRLYQANLDYFRALEQYIEAGEAKLRELDESVIPAQTARVESAGDMVQAQQLRDLRGVRDDLERRVHDLKLTRQVTMQGLPSIRLVQENDKGLINKINSTLVNTVPLWRQQLAQAVTIYRSGQAADTLRAATDLTNDLLRANADNLKSANTQARREIERGVFDIEVVRHANESLIATIEEGLKIADEGKRARALASQELERLEGDLRRALSAASAKSEGGSPGEGYTTRALRQQP
ncbi:toxic anion resistance protein [Candidatus Thiodictyon syntrophicum]|uniref:toxic anion resistance protein n=1 Tax=Candidatus Thiodictyon syntrophicum TaxID=1166950 RepID=UPI001F378A86|nr:toxic anion resistance protein [Candidatus Thiodictyon syntrophicum]